MTDPKTYGLDLPLIAYMDIQATGLHSGICMEENAVISEALS